MTRSRLRLERRRILSLLMILLGVGAILLAFAVDLVGAGGRSGFGLKQLLLALSGGAAAAIWLLTARAPRSVITEVEQWQGPGNYPSAEGDMRAIYYEGMNYIVNLGSGREELYDLREDWEQQRDLVRSASARVPLREMRDQLEAAFDRHASLPTPAGARG